MWSLLVFSPAPFWQRAVSPERSSLGCLLLAHNLWIASLVARQRFRIGHQLLHHRPLALTPRHASRIKVRTALHNMTNLYERQNKMGKWKVGWGFSSYWWFFRHRRNTMVFCPRAFRGRRWFYPLGMCPKFDLPGNIWAALPCPASCSAAWDQARRAFAPAPGRARTHPSAPLPASHAKLCRPSVLEVPLKYLVTSLTKFKKIPGQICLKKA